jgi:hypothetical protein
MSSEKELGPDRGGGCDGARQQRITERAENRAETTTKAISAPHTPTPAGRVGISPLSPAAAARQAFASQIARTEAAFRRWDGSSHVRWQSVGSISSSAGFAPGGRCWHQKFGSGIILEVDGDVLTIWFDDAGQKRIIDSFVESD